MKNIVEGKFFKRIEESWRLHGLKNGRLKVCARTCGIYLDMHENQFENKALNPWYKSCLKSYDKT